tara:strand:- start:1189 stop:1851 length:663 start_codon:yes stop_codon:yes gene_type:complete
MAKLYYGNGTCTIEGNARGVEISYRGNIEIEDKTPDGFAINANNQRILIFPFGGGTLSNLFDYVGNLEILSVVVANEQSEREPCTIHKVMDYSELLTSKAEDLTTKSEDLSAGYGYGRNVSKTSLKQPIIPNQHTSDKTSKYAPKLFFEDGKQYFGAFHIHLKDKAVMTGSEHSEDSQDLYFKQFKNGKFINKPIPTRNFRRETIRARKIKLRNKRASRK